MPVNQRRGGGRTKASGSAGKWTPAIAAASVLGVVVVAGITGRDGGNSSASTTSSVVTSTTLGAPVTSQPSVATVATTAPVPKTSLDRSLSYGMVGDSVKALQTRLKSLGFDPGEPDGSFGERTRQAVWAYEKLVLKTPRQQAKGVVTPEMWDHMQDPIVIQPRRPNSTPNHTEIYLPEQVLAVFHGQTPVLITHISSGDGQEWCEEVTISPGEYGNEKGTEPLKRGECGLSWTPGGVYTYTRMIAGRRASQLGGMYNPVYFNYGIAVHGAHEVPLHPASHGCVRIPMFISDYFQTLVAKGDQVFVFDGEKEPERYGAQKPRFNWLDPDYTTTTTSTSTTSTTTTSTTVPRAPTTTTTKPAATTTSPATSTTEPTTTTTFDPVPPAG